MCDECNMEAEKLPELVVSAIKSACASGKKLSWKIQESDRGMLVQLVWKPARISSAVSLSTVKVVSNWSNQKRKSPSRLRRDAKRLQSFQMAKLATKQSIGPVNPVPETAVERSDSQRSDTPIPDSAKSLAPLLIVIRL